jgi:diaminopimelate decarboxylase
MHHHLAASGNLGQVIKRNFPLCVAGRVDARERETVTIVGHLCTPLDVLARSVELPKAEVGDVIAIFQSGAYGASASPTNFLGHPAAREVLLSG